MNIETALVVDDSKSARFAMRKFLESRGYAVDCVESAPEAFAYLRQKRPHVIFLDHMMPEIDGFEAMEIIRSDALSATLPIVICSSNEGEEFVREARMHGATDVLAKPPSQEQIDAVIARVRASVDYLAAQAAPPAPAAPVAAPVAAVPPGSHKVQAIFEPEYAIEQVAMKALREALPSGPAVETLRAEAPVSVQPQAVHLSIVTPATLKPNAATHVPSADSLRGEMENRLRKITHDLHLQYAELKAQLAHLDAALMVRNDGEEQQVIAAEAAQTAVAALADNVDSMFAQLRTEIDAALDEQNQRLEEVLQAVRAIAADEAQAVAERVMMNAAARIADQMAESFLRVVRAPGQVQAA